MSAIRAATRAFILKEFLDPADADLFKDDTALISSRVIDSLALIRLVTFVETEFAIKLSPQEMDARSMDTVERIEALVLAKQKDRVKNG